MKCPKCRSEVGNQSVCPYCGGTVYVHGSTWSVEDFNKNTAPVGQVRDMRKLGINVREIERRLRNMETRINLTLILQCGEFVLILLTLLVLALK